MRRSTPMLGRSLLAAALTGSMLLNGGAADAAATTAIVTTAESAAAARSKFGPFGYRGIKLGMSAKKARATGKIRRVSRQGPCTTWRFRTPPNAPGGRADVVISKRLRVVGYIDAPRSARTPRGIGIGSTKRQVKRAYPKARMSGSGLFYAPLPRNPKGYYGFILSGGRTGKVEQMIMALDRQDCAN
ncbi:hypothetical protein HS048_36425 [Planomonospora sp. ID91781]|uniref:hypothetical protein n=1 Tax=Planomonospora sp. ID91781 TaxID=2738135 RepID=UPI0018C37829|nr:hypothetical protein [Planomonospora sp. ID91781]MBG0826155.1 hypothetical protein [Planomonospora sp. ID91781]